MASGWAVFWVPSRHSGGLPSSFATILCCPASAQNADPENLIQEAEHSLRSGLPFVAVPKASARVAEYLDDSLQKEKIMSSEYADDEKLLTKGEVAQLCRVDVRTVDRWLMSGKVRSHRTPSGRVLFRKAEVLTVVDPPRASRRRDG
jgi:excisionase family DNA binding protein